MSDDITLPPHEQALKERATEISRELDHWLDGNFSAEDDLAIAVALLRAGVNLHIRLMGQKDAMALLADMFSKSA